jgi:hypothetical protein
MRNSQVVGAPDVPKVRQRCDRARHGAEHIDAGSEAQRDVDALLGQVDVAVGHGEHHADVRIALHELGQQPGQVRVPEGHRGAHAQGAGGQGVDGARLFRHAQRVLEDRPAGLGQAQLPGRAVQESGVQRFFEPRHRLADVRFRPSHAARRLRKRTGFHDPDKGPDVGLVASLQQVHRISCGNNRFSLQRIVSP